MHKNLTVVVVVTAMVAGTAGYWLGSTAQSQPAASMMRAGQFSQGGVSGGMGRQRGQSGGLINGEVVGKDATSLTVKTSDGNSRIVLLSGSTTILKTASATLDDILDGVRVMVTGTANTDGSLTAQSIQVRPAGSSTR